MPTIARIILYCAAAAIVLGGLYDVFVPRLPSNLAAMCGGNQRASRLVRELLRALGGSLVAIGAAVALLVSQTLSQNRQRTLTLILLLVLPSEGTNSLAMARVGSPWLIPLSFILLALLGVFLVWPGILL